MNNITIIKEYEWKLSDYFQRFVFYCSIFTFINFYIFKSFTMRYNRFYHNKNILYTDLIFFITIPMVTTGMFSISLFVLLDQLNSQYQLI